MWIRVLRFCSRASNLDHRHDACTSLVLRHRALCVLGGAAAVVAVAVAAVDGSAPKVRRKTMLAFHFGMLFGHVLVAADMKSGNRSL